MSVRDERVRLFVALELPGHVVDELVAWRARALAGVAGLRLLAPESLHVTLCFLGSQPASAVNAIGDACASGATSAGAVPTALSLSDLVWLPPRRPGVAAVRIGDADGALAALQATLADALVSGGWYEREARPYLAHVTVARVSRGERVRPPRSVESPPEAVFSGPALTLFRSRPGSIYEPVRTIRLE